MKPHTHAKYVQAFIEGKTVQYRLPCDHSQWGEVTKFQHFDFYDVYRIKPAEKVVRWLWAYRSVLDDSIHVSEVYKTEDEAFQSWHGVTLHKKLEWSREEFDK
jgi:hypothetical protein